MAKEKLLHAIPPQAFTADGTARGQITLATTYVTILSGINLVQCLPFKVKQKVVVRADGEPNLELEIKRVLEDEHILFVGPLKRNASPGTHSVYREGDINSRTDLSAYTVAKNATIEVAEQQKAKIPEQEIERNTYEHEPTVARRVFNVDEWGRPYRKDNPFPVDASVNVGDIEVDITLPDTVEIYNINVAAANVEMSQVLPNNSQNFMVRVRDDKSSLKIGFVPGSTATTYINMPRGTNFTSPSVDVPNNFTVYFNSPKANVIIEILVWYNA
jgi:hypothetical protein